MAGGDLALDAVIGRLVLGHLPDPVEALRRLSRLVRPGGLVVFQDVDNSPLRVEPRTPLTSAVLQAVAAALTVNGSSLGSGHACTSSSDRRACPSPVCRRPHRWAVPNTTRFSSSSPRGAATAH
ncbi:class I SAM-dependent methyltransferase [Streptomyces sp. NPDC001890]|uniref:class I SAM-dependent methyltransferase n=1 Tax=Streptomyces sp. NPDC001890 TaxID=3364620 RepID=UPI0036A32B68